MAYAKLRFKPNDISLMQEVLTRRSPNIVKQQEAASSDKERAFYDNVVKVYGELLAKLAAPGGKVSLTEAQLQTLRGALFGGERLEVGQAYRSAHQAGDDALASVYAGRLSQLELLDDILSQPLINDRSQDTDEDEDDEEQGDDENEA